MYGVTRFKYKWRKQAIDKIFIVVDITDISQ